MNTIKRIHENDYPIPNDFFTEPFVFHSDYICDTSGKVLLLVSFLEAILITTNDLSFFSPYS